MTDRATTWTLALPLYEDVLFVDWHGVMSEARFWQSYVATAGGPSQSEVEQSVKDLFLRDSVILKWMKGDVSTATVVDEHLLRHSKPFEENQRAVLKQVLMNECERVKADRWMMACLRQIRRKRHIVLATDNMDCFVDGIQLRGDLSRVFDDYISSSDVGVLKSEDPSRFFGRWMELRGIDPKRGILIDDDQRNCAAFESLGGRSILFGANEGRVDVLELVWPLSEVR